MANLSLSGTIGDPEDQVVLVEDQGEDESDLGSDGAGFSAAIAAKDWTVETLVSQMRKGRIDLTPAFQRRNAWLDNRKSRLIESILLGFPIPQIVLAEKAGHPGSYFVLDGKQRLLALRQFFVDRTNSNDDGFDELTLQSLEVLPELNRLDAAGLEREKPDLVAALENYTIRTVVLSQWNSENLLLSLFLRLNTGSVPLSPQELRQALIPGRFIEWLDAKSGDLASLRTLLGNSHPDRRMVDAELVLRHLAFSLSTSTYRGNLKLFLDDTSRAFNSDWSYTEGPVSDELRNMDLALSSMIELYGRESACRKWSGVKFERALNRAIFDVQIYSMSFEAVREAVSQDPDEVMTAFKQACVSNTSFIRSVSSTTKTHEAFLTRHRTWQAIIKRVCNVSYPLPAPLGEK